MAKTARIFIIGSLIILILMAKFPILPPRPVRRGRRISQRDIGAQAVRGHQMGALQESDERVVDETGLVSTANFNFNSLSDATERGAFTSLTLADIDNTSLSFNLVRTGHVLIMFVVTDQFTEDGTGGFGAGWIYLDIDGSNDLDTFMRAGHEYSTGEGGNSPPLTQSYIKTHELSAGDHTIKLQAASHPSGEDFFIEQTTILYLVLGT
jgi:hypothetical protein